MTNTYTDSELETLYSAITAIDDHDIIDTLYAALPADLYDALYDYAAIHDPIEA